MPVECAILAPGAACKAVRERRGVSQSQLAEVLGVERATLSRYEAELIPMTVPRFLAIAEALRVTPGLLLTLAPDDPVLQTLTPLPSARPVARRTDDGVDRSV